MIHLANTYNTLGRLQDAVEIEERVQHFQQRFLSHDDPNIGELKTFLFVFGCNLMLLLLSPVEDHPVRHVTSVRCIIIICTVYCV